MQKLNKKSGLSLIEILCALSILSISFVFITTIQLNNLKLINYNKERSKYLFVLEAVKEEILHNCAYEEIRQLYLQDKRMINNQLLTIENIKDLELSEIFKGIVDDKKAYLLLDMEDGPVLKINLELHLFLGTKEEIYECDFFKGNYI